MDNWYRLSKDETLQQLNSNPQNGLSDAEVSQKLEAFGPNELIDRGIKSPWKILWEQLTGIMVVILIISAVISIFLHEYVDAIVILIIVVLNAILGFTQEYQAEQAMAALKKMAVPHVRTRRNGKVSEIEASQLVPGDIVLLEAGNAVPADCRLIEVVNLKAQEAVLTGESEPVTKKIEALENDKLQVGDQKNMVFMGTNITYGRGQAVVVNTGMKTELGKIAEMIQSIEQDKTPLQNRIAQLGKSLAFISFGIVVVVFLLGVLRGESIKLMFQTSISMAVAAIPEGLPAVVTIALALGAKRMLKRNALIRKLPAVETLGSVSVICSDKTGTLTENRMTVTFLDVAGNRLDVQEMVRGYSPSVSSQEKVDPELLKDNEVSMLLLGGTLCNDAVLEKYNEDQGGYSTIGDPTEGALVIAAARAGLWKDELDQKLPRVSELPFDSNRKRMTTVHEFKAANLPDSLKGKWGKLAEETPYLVMTKGSVDGLLEISDRVIVQGKIEELSQEWKDRILIANNDMAEKGMRVLGVAFRSRDKAELDEQNDPLEAKLIFTGMFGMIDPARPEVFNAVKSAKEAGIRPIMITGDHPLTALHIAQELGITEGKSVITGQKLADMEVKDLEKQVEEVSVFARVSPEHKLKIVSALQNKGYIVSMTGDGVNDAPALKKADIGVAMGITGTDVSKEASDMVLLDDNFATIVAAVEEGRRIYDNIRKFIKYTLTSNAGEILVMLLAPFFGMPLPLTPIQILWVNLVTDGLPGLALTIEKPEKNTMKRPPYSPQENIFGRGLARDIVWIGLLIGVLSLGVGFYYFENQNLAWQTMIFTTLTLTQMGNALAVRSEQESLLQVGILSNKKLVGSVLLTFLLQLAVIYIPFLQNVFNTVSLSFGELAVSVVSGLLVLLAIDLVKVLRQKVK